MEVLVSIAFGVTVTLLTFAFKKGIDISRKKLIDIDKIDELSQNQIEINKKLDKKEELDASNHKIWSDMLEEIRQLNSLFFDSRQEHLIFKEDILILDDKVKKNSECIINIDDRLKKIEGKNNG
jgi:hypothetical protein